MRSSGPPVSSTQMKFFKLELQNREENFNQRFGGGPRVGLVDPLGGKGGGAGGGSSRTLNVGAGAMGVGGSGVGGMGISVGGGSNAASRRTTPPNESAEAIAARLAREDARTALKPKRQGREVAQGAGMHAALGLGASGGDHGSSSRLNVPRPVG